MVKCGERGPEVQTEGGALEFGDVDPIGAITGVIGALAVLVPVVGLVVRRWGTRPRRPGQGSDAGEAGPLPWMVDQTVPNGVERPEAMDALLGALLSGPARTVGVTTALAGAGGFGKTTLAKQLGCRPETKAHYPGGLLWVTVGEDTAGPDLAARIGFLCEQLGADPVQESDPDRAGWRLGRLLDARPPTLLVVDDVWTAEQLGPFLHAGARCSRLVTTRMPRLVPAGSMQVLVDEMNPEQSRQLLSAGLELVPGAIEPLLGLTGRWPLLMALVHAAVADRVRYGAGAGQAVAEHVRLLEVEGPQAGDDLGKNWYRDRLVTATVTASLDRLEAGERARYRELAIFPEDTAIPRSVVAMLWAATGSLSPEQTDRLCARLGSLSLLAADSDDGLRLHDVLRSYLRHDLGDAAAAIHAQLLDAAAGLIGGAEDNAAATVEWWRLPLEYRYLWGHLTYHLRGSRRYQELAALAEDLRWTRERVAHFGSVAAETDLVGTSSTAARVLRQVLARHAHVLTRAANGEDLTATLLACVDGYPELTALARRLRESADGVVLTVRWHAGGGNDAAVRRVIAGYASRINAVAVAPDGSWLATAGGDRSVRIWDTDSGIARGKLKDHSVEMNAVAVAPDGSWLVAAGGDGTVVVWDAVTGTELRRWSEGRPGSVRHLWTRLRRRTVEGAWLNAVAVSPDGSWLATAGDDGIVSVRDTATGTCRLRWQTDGRNRWQRLSARLRRSAPWHSSVLALVVAPDGSWLATAGSDGTARIWDTATGALRQTLAGHTDWVRAVAVSPDGSWLVTSGDDQTVWIWEVATGLPRRTVEGHKDWVRAVAVSPDGSWLVTAGDDNTARIWDTGTGALRDTLKGHTGWVEAVAVAPDGRWLVTAGLDGTCRIWEVPTRSAPATDQDPSGWIDAVAVSPDGSWMATAGDDAAVRVWDTSTGGLRATLRGHHDPLHTVMASADGTLLATGGVDRTARIWDTATWSARVSLDGFPGSVNTVEFSPDGSWLATASNDGAVRVWDTASGALRADCSGDRPRRRWSVRDRLPRRTAEAPAAYGALASPDGDWMVVAVEDSPLEVWNTATWTHRVTIESGTGWLNAAVIGPNSAWVAAASASTVRIWAATTGALLATLNHEGEWVRAMAVAPDSSWLATGSDSTVRIWNVPSGTLRTTLVGHADSVTAVAVSPDGLSLASAAADNAVRIWDVTTGSPVSFLRLPGGVRWCGWGGSREWLAVTGPTGLAVLDVHWDGRGRRWSSASGPT